MCSKNRLINRIKRYLFLTLVLSGFSSFGQGILDEITDRYNSQVPIDFGELSLTKVGFNDSFFVYSYQYENLKSEWNEDSKLGAIMWQGNDISKTINELTEFITIRNSGKSIAFLYHDLNGEPIYVIVFKIKDKKYEIDLEESFKSSGIDPSKR